LRCKNPERSLSVLVFSNSKRGLALPVTDAAVLEARRLARRGSDKRSSRSKLTRHHRVEKFFPRTETDPPQILKFFQNGNAHLYRLGRESAPGNGSIR
jgi:hypothetical protein